jgi:DNA repair protein RecO (recombination protein O)
MTAASKNRRSTEPAFLLHRWSYRETSLIIEVFSSNFGRLSLIARGARRAKSAFRSALHPFQPLHLSWYGHSELRNLSAAEWVGGMSPLTGTALICGFYLNELLIKLLPRDDPHENLYRTYFETLGELKADADNAAILRRFEQVLLKELGYELTLDQEAESGDPVDAIKDYHYVVDRGPLLPQRTGANENKLELSGKTLLDMANNNYNDPVTLAQSKALMRMLISHHLGNQVLHTRQLLRDLQQL